MEIQGARVLGNGKPRTGAYGLPVVFLDGYATYAALTDGRYERASVGAL